MTARILSTFTPISSAALLSWAVARIDLPVSVRARKNQSPAVIRTAIRNEIVHGNESESSIGAPRHQSERYQAFVA